MKTFAEKRSMKNKPQQVHDMRRKGLPTSPLPVDFASRSITKIGKVRSTFVISKKIVFWKKALPNFPTSTEEGFKMFLILNSS